MSVFASNILFNNLFIKYFSYIQNAINVNISLINCIEQMSSMNFKYLILPY